MTDPASIPPFSGKFAVAVDFTKPVQTRDGRKVRLLCVDASNTSPIIGLVRETPSVEICLSWDPNGCFGGSPVLGNVHLSRYSDHDLVNVKDPVEQRCKTCKHWCAFPPDYDDPWGACDMAAMEGPGEADDGDHPRGAVHPETMAVAQDASQYRAHLATSPEFGCLLWKAKP